MTYYYFAYSEEMNKEYMKKICPDSYPVNKVKLFGARYYFNDKAILVSDKRKKTNAIEGALYKISEDDIRKLDKRKECPGKFKKVNVIVIDKYNNSYKAFMYTMQKRCGYKLPNNNYFNFIADGYSDWGINPNVLFNAWTHTAEELKLLERDE